MIDDLRAVVAAMVAFALPGGVQAGALHDAVKSGDGAEVERLVASGADINEIDFQSGSPLHIAALRGHPQMFRQVIDASANVNAREFGRDSTPLHWAALGGHAEAATILVTAGAALDPLAQGGFTPLLEALARGRREVSLRLIELGADVVARSGHRLTPLHLASLAEFDDVVAALRTRGAAPPEPADIKPLLIVSDASEGQKLFTAKCRTCHEPPASRAHGRGPSLWGVVGRKIGTDPGYAYSAALARVDGLWDYEALNRLLADPIGFYPGTDMYFRSTASLEVTDVRERAGIVAYLRGQSDNPFPLP